MESEHAEFPLPATESYLACPRCGLIVLQEAHHNGSPLCPQCREDDEIVVKMDLVADPDAPRP